VLTQEEQQKAAEIQSRLTGVLDQIRADSGLNDRERQRQLARATLAAQNLMRELRSSSTARAEYARKTAYVGCFGIDPDYAADERTIRAALTREQPGPVEISARMEAALRVEDITEAKVIAEYAFSRRDDPLGGDSFRGTLDSFANYHPTIRAAMIKLAEVSSGDGDSGSDRLARMSDKLATEIGVPPEIQHGDLNSYAADDVPAAAQPAGMPFGVA
jgi:hypothetical protein